MTIPSMGGARSEFDANMNIMLSLASQLVAKTAQLSTSIPTAAPDPGLTIPALADHHPPVDDVLGPLLSMGLPPPLSQSMAELYDDHVSRLRSRYQHSMIRLASDCSVLRDIDGLLDRSAFLREAFDACVHRYTISTGRMRDWVLEAGRGLLCGGVEDTPCITKQAARVLEAAYSCRQNYLNSKEKALIAEKAGITERQVLVWFQNRRQRGPSRTLLSEGQAFALSNGNVQTEVGRIVSELRQLSPHVRKEASPIIDIHKLQRGFKRPRSAEEVEPSERPSKQTRLSNSTASLEYSGHSNTHWATGPNRSSLASNAEISGTFSPSTLSAFDHRPQTSRMRVASVAVSDRSSDSDTTLVEPPSEISLETVPSLLDPGLALPISPISTSPIVPLVDPVQPDIWQYLQDVNDIGIPSYLDDFTLSDTTDLPLSAFSQDFNDLLERAFSAAPSNDRTLMDAEEHSTDVLLDPAFTSHTIDSSTNEDDVAFLDADTAFFNTLFGPTDGASAGSSHFIHLSEYPSSPDSIQVESYPLPPLDPTFVLEPTAAQSSRSADDTPVVSDPHDRHATILSDTIDQGTMENISSHSVPSPEHPDILSVMPTSRGSIAETRRVAPLRVDASDPSPSQGTTPRASMSEEETVSHPHPLGSPCRPGQSPPTAVHGQPAASDRVHGGAEEAGAVHINASSAVGLPQREPASPLPSPPPTRSSTLPSISNVRQYIPKWLCTLLN